MRNPVFLVIAGLAILVSASSMAQTAITYQGELLDDSGPANGTVQMEFMLYDDEAGTNLLGMDGPQSVEVNDGLFQVELDFGNVYSDPPVYLQIVVDGTPLLDLQKLTPAPAAVSAATASSAATAVTADSADSAESASSVPWSGVTDAPRFWRLGGNDGTDPLSEYIGTSDFTTLALRVDNRQVLRIIPSEQSRDGFSPNLIGGHPENDVDESTDDNPPIIGAVIGGGGSPGSANLVGADFATIGGGASNTASSNEATVGGGAGNTASGSRATVGGGKSNTASGSFATVGGGIFNVASGRESTVPGGFGNCAGGKLSMALGQRAKVRPGSDPDDDSACDSLPSYPGGNGDTGTFVWADDSSNLNFISTGSNQFLVRAAGGIGLNTNRPDAPLHLASESNWDLTNTEGDFKIGNDTFRFKLGVSLGGAGAGNVRLHAQGGTHNLILGSNETDVVKVNYFAGLDPTDDNVFSLGSSGARWKSVWATDGTINTSDARLKRDVAPLDGALDAVLALRPVTYRWKERPDAGERLGLIAQEVRPVLPEVVEGAEANDFLGIRYAELLPVVIAAMQEQQARLRQLSAENAQLRDLAERNAEVADRNAELEARMAALEAVLFEQRRVAERR